MKVTIEDSSLDELPKLKDKLDKLGDEIEAIRTSNMRFIADLPMSLYPLIESLVKKSMESESKKK